MRVDGDVSAILIGLGCFLVAVIVDSTPLAITGASLVFLVGCGGVIDAIKEVK